MKKGEMKENGGNCYRQITVRNTKSIKLNQIEEGIRFPFFPIQFLLIYGMGWWGKGRGIHRKERKKRRKEKRRKRKSKVSHHRIYNIRR